MNKIRTLICVLSIGLLTNCFQIMHFLDLKDDGTMMVQWSFRFSKALEDMGKKGDGSQGPGLSDEMEKGKKDIPAKMGSLVKDLKMETIKSEFDSGLRLSFSIPNFVKADFKSIPDDDFPYFPRYDAKKKQIIFHFQPMKKDKDKKDEKASASPPPAPEKTEKTEKSEPSEPAKDEGMGQMGDQIGKLFLSSVRYQILLGKNIHPVAATVKQGTIEKKLEIQILGEQTLIDLPLFALYGDKEQPFDLVLQLK